MKILSKISTFQTNTIIEVNKIQYRIITKGHFCPKTNKKSKAITFDFSRVDNNKLTEKENKIGDCIFDEMIKD